MSKFIEHYTSAKNIARIEGMPCAPDKAIHTALIAACLRAKNDALSIEEDEIRNRGDTDDVDCMRMRDEDIAGIDVERMRNKELIEIHDHQFIRIVKQMRRCDDAGTRFESS